MVKVFKTFLREKRGAAAVEFAIVGPIFLAFVLSSLELGMAMVKTAMLDNAVNQAAKFVYVGAASAGDPTEEELQEYICKRAVVFSDCLNNIATEVTVLANYHDKPANDAPCVDSQNVDVQPTVRYTPGASSDIVLMRVCVTTNVITPGFGLGLRLAKTDTNRQQIVSTFAFMNEPF